MKRLEVFESEDGEIFRTEAECRHHEGRARRIAYNEQVLDSLSSHLHQSDIERVASQLEKQGYQIVSFDLSST